MRLRASFIVLGLTVVATACSGSNLTLNTGPAPWPNPDNVAGRIDAAGLPSSPTESLTVHYHSHLDIFVNGAHVKIPAGIGIDTRDKAVQSSKIPDGSTAYGGIRRCPRVCISPLHTHADLGVLHTETDKPVPNRLGQFFVEWGVRLDRSCVGGYCKPDSIRVYVDGQRYLGDPRRILLADRSEIAIVIGTLPKKIPSAFPAGAVV